MNIPIPITPENPPQFPCWLYLQDPKYPRWERRVSVHEHPEWKFALCGWSHWHPDSPTAPTVRPEEGEPEDKAFLETLDKILGSPAPSGDTVPAWAKRAAEERLSPAAAAIIREWFPELCTGLSDDTAEFFRRGMVIQSAIDAAVTRHAPTPDATAGALREAAAKACDTYDNQDGTAKTECDHNDAIQELRAALAATMKGTK